MVCKSVNRKSRFSLLFLFAALTSTILAQEAFQTRVLLDYRPSAQIETPGPFIALDDSNNLYAAGGGVGAQPWTDNWKIIKYEPNGSVVWTATYDGPADGSDRDRLSNATLDTFGNFYVTGYSIGIGTSGDYTTIKYAPDSNEPLWIARYNGLANDEDYVKDIAVDSLGNVYVTGESEVDGAERDCVTVKYDANGNEVWVAIYGGSSYDEGTAIALDSNDNIYVTGFTAGEWTDNDYLTIKYAPDSNEAIWVARYDGPPGNRTDEAIAIAIDENNNIYVTGPSIDVGKGYDYVTVKYTPDSNQPVWVARYNGPGNDFDIPYAMTLDRNGNICVTGRSTGSGADYDWATVKYDPNGDEIWVARYNSGENSYDRAAAVVSDALNNIYVTGETGTGAGLTIKYPPDSNEPLWMNQYNNLAESFVGHLAIDSSNNVYVGGYSTFDPDTASGEQFIVRYKQCHQAGDMDCDGDVDFYDFAILGNYWLQNACGDCGGAEVSGDGNVNAKDLAKLPANWLAGK
jgi:hypothetical protein